MKLCPLLLAAIASVLPAAFGAAPLAEWTFDQPGDLQGWQPNGDLADVSVANGALACRAIGSDPILQLQPLLAVTATPRQQIEIRLKADHGGQAEIFWSNAATRITQEKSTRFEVTGDNQWHTYRILPFWHPEGKIERLRFDLYNQAKFEVDFIRLSELAPQSPAPAAAFDFTAGSQGWQGIGDTRLTADPAGLKVSGSEADAVALSPPLTVPAEELNYVSLGMAVDRGTSATLFFATEGAHGLQSFTFPVAADGRDHTYNLDLIGATGWHGRVIALGLRPSDAPGARTCLRWLKVTDAPQGPAQLKLVSFALENAMPRSGAPATLAATITNTGGENATKVQAQLRLPAGVTILSTASDPAGELGFGEEATWRWTVQADRPIKDEASIVLTAAGVASLTARTSLEFTTPLAVARTGYVPEPKPVRGPVEVGAYYFPGWDSAARWQPLRNFPERKPVLGWYREGSPEVADWQIKWAVEHGITFFAYDWYWSQGTRQLEQALHDGFFNTRYHHLLKFCLLWANHNPPSTSSREDCLAVTRYWIANYFRRPEHLSIDGKPVMIIFSTERLTADLGSAGVKAAFEAI